jgi:hydroxyethylthiazole kinase-like uncharacterized protein yjeF
MKPLDALNLIQQLRRADHAHKGHAGKVLLIGGAPSMAGALVLAGQAALYSGAGWVQLMMLDEGSAHVVLNHPELMVHKAIGKQPSQFLSDIKPDVVAIGPGLGTHGMALAWTEAALAWHGPLILDADALNLLSMNANLMSTLRHRSFPSVITPHPGEAARLLKCSAQEVQAQRLKSLEALIELTQSTVVLKGHHSLVGSVNQESLECLAGNPGMAVGGMGDVLTGCVAALVAQGLHHQLDMWQSTCLAVQVHSTAGDQLLANGIGPVGMTASELAKQLRAVINAQLS